MVLWAVCVSLQSFGLTSTLGIVSFQELAQGAVSLSSMKFALCGSQSAQLLHQWVSNCLFVAVFFLLLFKHSFCWKLCQLV